MGSGAVSHLVLFIYDSDHEDGFQGSIYTFVGETLNFAEADLLLIYYFYQFQVINYQHTPWRSPAALFIGLALYIPCILTHC